MTRERKRSSPSLNVDQLDIEDQVRIRGDDAARATRAVAVVSADIQRRALSFRHLADPFIPAANHLAKGVFRGVFRGGKLEEVFFLSSPPKHKQNPLPTHSPDADHEFEGLVAVTGRVELLAVGQGAGVVHDDGLERRKVFQPGGL